MRARARTRTRVVRGIELYFEAFFFAFSLSIFFFFKVSTGIYHSSGVNTFLQKMLMVHASFPFRFGFVVLGFVSFRFVPISFLRCWPTW